MFNPSQSLAQFASLTHGWYMLVRTQPVFLYDESAAVFDCSKLRACYTTLKFKWPTCVSSLLKDGLVCIYVSRSDAMQHHPKDYTTTSQPIYIRAGYGMQHPGPFSTIIID